MSDESAPSRGFSRSSALIVGLRFAPADTNFYVVWFCTEVPGVRIEASNLPSASSEALVRILALNSGSSSIKTALVDLEAPARRLEAMRTLSEAGVPVSVMVAPIVPGLNDHEVERILDLGKAAGAQEASYVLLRLPLEVSRACVAALLARLPEALAGPRDASPAPPRAGA